ncbi:MAG: cyanoexosortase A [Nostocaceae cyanobacterium]|nr:cyanoexosortase A [Nostocaceae cyanobacterium]
MKSLQPPIKILKNAKFWLLGIGAGLITINLTLLSQSGEISQFAMSVLFFLAVASLIWDNRHSLILESEIFSSFLGGLMIAFVLWKSATLPSPDFLRLSPVFSGLGLALLASGIKGLKQYWQSLTILFFLGVPEVILSSLIDISPLIAKFSGFILWYSGFTVSIQGVHIHLPKGGVEVTPGCSGLESMSYLLGISAIALVMFPIQKQKRIFVPIVATTLAFVLNGIRIAILAVFSASGNKAAFDSWHQGDVSRMFSMIAIVIFGLFYYLLMRQSEAKISAHGESSRQ